MTKEFLHNDVRCFLSSAVDGVNARVRQVRTVRLSVGHVARPVLRTVSARGASLRLVSRC
jgi:hypothetical protein